MISTVNFMVCAPPGPPNGNDAELGAHCNDSPGGKPAGAAHAYGMGDTFFPSESSCSCSLVRSSVASGRLVKILMRFSRVLNAIRNAAHRSPSEPCAAAGSGKPQCAVIGRPGQNGHASPAALSQTVNTKSREGAAGPANSSQLLLPRTAVDSCIWPSSSSAIGGTAPSGWLPALQPRNRPRPQGFTRGPGNTL